MDERVAETGAARLLSYAYIMAAGYTQIRSVYRNRLEERRARSSRYKSPARAALNYCGDVRVGA